VPGGAFDTTAPLVGIAALGVTQASDAQFPGRGIDLEVASETDIAIWEGTIDNDGTAARGVALLVRTMGGDERKYGLGVGGWITDQDIRHGMAKAALTANPLAVATLIVVSIEVETVAVGAEGIAQGVIAALQAGEGIFVGGVTAQLDGAQGLQVVVDKEQDIVEAFPSVADQFTDREMREATSQTLEAGDGLEVKYISAPNYLLVGKGKDPKRLEGLVKERAEEIVKDIEKNQGEASFELVK